MVTAWPPRTGHDHDRAKARGTAASARDQRRAQRGAPLTWAPAGGRQPGGKDHSSAGPRPAAADACPDGRRLAPRIPARRCVPAGRCRSGGRDAPCSPLAEGNSVVPEPAAPHPSTTSPGRAHPAGGPPAPTALLLTCGDGFCGPARRVAPVHCCTGAPSGPRMHVVRAHGPGKPLGRLRSSAAPRCFPPAGANFWSGGRWRARGAFACLARHWACHGGPGGPPRSPSW